MSLFDKGRGGSVVTFQIGWNGAFDAILVQLVGLIIPAEPTTHKHVTPPPSAPPQTPRRGFYHVGTESVVSPIDLPAGSSRAYAARLVGFKPPAWLVEQGSTYPQKDAGAHAAAIPIRLDRDACWRVELDERAQSCRSALRSRGLRRVQRLRENSLVQRGQLNLSKIL